MSEQSKVQKQEERSARLECEIATQASEHLRKAMYFVGELETTKESTMVANLLAKAAEVLAGVHEKRAGRSE